MLPTKNTVIEKTLEALQVSDANKAFLLNASLLIIDALKTPLEKRAIETAAQQSGVIEKNAILNLAIDVDSIVASIPGIEKLPLNKQLFLKKALEQSITSIKNDSIKHAKTPNNPNAERQPSQRGKFLEYLNNPHSFETIIKNICLNILSPDQYSLNLGIITRGKLFSSCFKQNDFQRLALIQFKDALVKKSLNIDDYKEDDIIAACELLFEKHRYIFCASIISQTAFYDAISQLLDDAIKNDIRCTLQYKMKDSLKANSSKILEVEEQILQAYQSHLSGGLIEWYDQDAKPTTQKADLLKLIASFSKQESHDVAEVETQAQKADLLKFVDDLANPDSTPSTQQTIKLSSTAIRRINYHKRDTQHAMVKPALDLSKVPVPDEPPLVRDRDALHLPGAKEIVIPRLNNLPSTSK